MGGGRERQWVEPAGAVGPVRRARHTVIAGKDQAPPVPTGLTKDAYEIKIKV